MMKNLIYFIILYLVCTNSALAQPQNAYLEYNSYKYAFRTGDETKFLKNGNKSLLLWEKAQSNTDKSFYLQEAMRYYFLLLQAVPNSVEANIGLGRVYDYMKQDRIAQKHFFTALNINNCDAMANYYFANYYYSRNEFISALNYYKKALSCGYPSNYEINIRIGSVYEKLADIESAKKHYESALKLIPSNFELNEKVKILNGLNYNQSQYYLFNNIK